MLLQALRDYEIRSATDEAAENAVPPEYTVRSVPWIVFLHSNGRNATVVRTSGGRPKNDPGKPLCVPMLRRQGTAIKPQLLCDTAEFVFAMHAKDSSRARALSRRREFIALLDAAAVYTGARSVRLVAEFLHHSVENPPELPSDMKPEDWVTFQVDDERPIDLQEVRSFWAQLAPRLSQRGLPKLTAELVFSWMNEDGDDRTGQCIICGHTKRIARIHPLALRVPRAVSDKQLSLISAKEPAFWSYGLEQSYIAPTCRPCAEAYARGANRLIADRSTSIVVGDATYLFWTREKVAFSFLEYFRDPQPEQVRELIASIRSGRRVPVVDDERFYATSISASGARAVIRDWIDTTVGQAKKHVAQWFEAQELIDPWGKDRRILSLSNLAAATVREDAVPSPSTSRSLLRAALTGTPVSTNLLLEAVRRMKAEHGEKRDHRWELAIHQRTALIKLVLLTGSHSLKEDEMVEVESTNRNPGYLCGRLFAELEQAQVRAIPGATTTIAGRFYGAASSTPASVFPQLLRGARNHLNKLERDQRGVYLGLLSRIEEISSHLESFPRVLTLEDQGLFALGYYHQRALDRKQAREAAERKRTDVARTRTSDFHSEEEQVPAKTVNGLEEN